MKRSQRQLRLRVHGVVVAEFALLLPVIVLFLSGVLFFGRIFWHYTVAQKAVHDAVRFLATAPAAEFKIQGTGPTLEAPVAAVARAIVAAEIAELDGGGSLQPVVAVQCDEDTCAGLVPEHIRVRVTLFLYDPFFEAFTSQFNEGNPIVLKPTATMYYEKPITGNP
jgi:hypothetical protein